MENKYNLIHCRYHKEIEGFGAYCSTEKCPYGSYQINNGSINCCKINGHIDPTKIPKNKKSKLLNKDLEATVSIQVFEGAIQS